MASSSKPKTYDVFLSFRGTDVRKNFVSHLYANLDQLGIYTYSDTAELRKGGLILPELMQAIEESEIAIVVFSEDYASSSWCLEEVTRIMECKEQGNLVVFPVFYKVEPREVRTPRQSYRKAMLKQQSKYGRDSEEVKRWKNALLNAGSLSGWHLGDGEEAGFVQDLTREISARLKRVPLDVAKYPVGIDSRIQELKKILNLQSQDDVIMVGLWGTGGVGKTAIAKATYNAIYREFQGSSFSERIRENSESSNYLVSLQEKLLSQVLLGKELTIYSVAGGSQLIQKRLGNKKVLIILDDVDDACQLNALAGNCKWFGKGSRIIITTRNKHLLTSHGVRWDHLYEVKALEDGQALELFRKHAFPENHKIRISSSLVDSVLHYASRLPLALEVLGSFLCGRGEDQWESALQKLAKIPEKKINDVLKVSYDGLDDQTKQLFLDIACFFKGRRTKYIKKILDSCDFHTAIEVQILIENSLISEENETLQMHDLIQAMGMDIVQQECRDDPKKRSRLWRYDDVLDVLSGDVGTDAIRAIVLELPKPKEMFIGPNAFTKMRKLRLLIMHNVYNYFRDPIHLPNDLRWFEWPDSAWIPEFSCGPKKLVGLDMRKSKIKEVREQFKDFEELKFINLSECQSVICMPNLDCTPNLEELDLRGCINLEHAHESVAYHGKLQLLNLSGCSRLHHLPNVLQSENLQLLNLNHCSKLLRFPHIPKQIKGFRKLYSVGTSIEELPASIENLVSLEKMDLSYCQKLAILPSSIYRLQNLEMLALEGCSKLVNFPKKEDSSDPIMEIGFPKLVFLNLSGCNLSEVGFLENQSCFPLLGALLLSYCQHLREIPKIPGQLSLLVASSCESLSMIPSDICHVDTIDLSCCHELVPKGFTMNDLFKLEQIHLKSHCQAILPGIEMPVWLLPDKEGCISFMAAEDLYKKFLGLVFCVVFQVKEGKEDVKFQLLAYVNGKRTMEDSTTYSSLGLDHVWLDYRESELLWGGDDFDPDGWSHFQFKIMASEGGIVKKYGFRLLCRPLENDLEVLFQDNQLLDPALLYELWHEDGRTSIKEERLSEPEDSKTST